MYEMTEVDFWCGYLDTRLPPHNIVMTPMRVKFEMLTTASRTILSTYSQGDLLTEAVTYS